MARKEAVTARHRGPPAVKQTTIKDVLEDARNTDFQDKAACKRFQEKHRPRLSKDPNLRYQEDEVLNELARKESVGVHRNFIKWAIETHRSLLFCKTDGGYTPLHLAIRKGNHEFVGLVLQYASNIQALLIEKSDLDMTCLHFAINYRSPFTEEIIAKSLDTGAVVPIPSLIGGLGSVNGPSSPADIFTIQSKDHQNGFDGMTPLHMAAVSKEHEPEDDAFMATRKNFTSSKSISYVADEMDEYDPNDGRFASPGQPQFTAKRPSPAQRPRSPLHVDTGLYASEAPDKFVVVSKGLQRTRTMDMSRAPQSPGGADTPKDNINLLKGAKKFNLLDIVKKLVDANPRVLVDYRDGYGDTPFQARVEYQRELQDISFAESDSEVQREMKHHEMIEKNPTLRYLRTYIIDKFDRRNAMKALYKVGDERVLEFDLSGLPYSSINTEFLYGLGKVLRFEGMLKYVALPRLTVEDEDSMEATNGTGGANGAYGEQGQAGKSNPGAGLQNMYTIFQWLRKHHVKSVLKVTVVDDAEPSHSDEAIERCLSGLDVRIWNWYRVDLCCDVIVNAAENARDVTLYSSGNNAVLVGWSSMAGLPRLKELEKVHINVREGLERQRRLESYMQRFQEELLKNKPGVKCTWDLLKSGSKFNSVFVERGEGKVTESKWMKSMADFADFLKSAKPQVPVKPVKIAIIDDGIDTSLDDFTGKIQVGESFYQLGELFGGRGTYYVPTGQHGTLMAKSICKICPMVKLYIAQLEVVPGQNGQRSFTAESATEAIHWAVDQGVDIISMSWSISGRSVLDRLEEALRRASADRIIMFCASIDEGPSSIDKTYPGKAGNCIKIGASTATGAKLSWVSGSNSDFLLPGEAPLTASSDSRRWNQSNGPHPYMGSYGSSVSTALAAGLAGTLLYCDRLLESESEDDESTAGIDGVPAMGGGMGGTGSSVGTVDDLRTTNKMKEVFKTLSKGTELNRFPQVWDHLPQNPSLMVWNEKADPDGTARTKSELDEFMKRVKR